MTDLQAVTDEPAAPSVELAIDGVQTLVVDLPTRRSHGFAKLSIDAMSYLIVLIHTSGGLVGIGEGAVPGGPWWGGESTESMKAIIDSHLGPALIGLDASRVQEVRARMDRLIPHNHFAKSALEMAAHDLWGKGAGMPLVELLGGRMRDQLPVTWALSAGNLAGVLDETRERLVIGHTRFKLKMGAAPQAQDLHRAEAVMAELDGRAQLTVDPNGSWDEFQARWFCRELAALGVESIEQPVPGWNRDALRRLADRCEIPLMADESLITVQDAVELSRDTSVGIFSIKLPKAGGLINAATVASIAEATGRRCFGGSTLEGTIGAAASTALYCSRPTLEQCELIGPQLLADDVAHGVTYEHGAVRLPQGPGLGITLDDEKLAHYARCRRQC